jgi:competence protein ComEC
LLIDGGLTNEYFDSGRSIVGPFLQWKGKRSLDGILISHPEMDHMGGLLTVMDRVPPGRVWWNPINAPSDHLQAIFSAARARRALILPADRNQAPIRPGGATIWFLNRSFPGIGSGVSHRDLNNSSAVCRVEYGKVSLLFTGDLEQEGEQELLAKGVPLNSTVLKVGHHGGLTSSTREFLEAVRPKVAVISCEGPTSHSFPRPQVLERLESAGAQVFVTGRDGAITIKTDGKDLRIQTGRSDKATKQSN